MAESRAPEAGAPKIVLSDNAARRIALLLKREQNPNVRLRVSVAGGGCSGFQYRFDFDDKLNEDDLVFEKAGAVVVIDEVSVNYLAGSEIDFVEDLAGAAFSIRNPQAASSCGCGNSFSLL